jgi:hypothetical protein
MTDDDAEDEGYDVGYGKPPKHTRFKPGRSGNPRGRPRKTRDINRLLQDELDKSIIIKEGGREKRITKREALMAQIVNCAIKGEFRPMQLVLAHLEKHRELDPFVATEADDAELLRALGMPQVKQIGKPGSDDGEN